VVAGFEVLVPLHHSYNL
jgi:hypothetical protein